MSKRARRNHSPLFRAKVAIDAIKGDKTLAELARYINFHNTERQHSSLDRKTPAEFYFAALSAIKQAA